MARPRKDLSDAEIFSIKEMAGFGLNIFQISAVLGMSKRTLERRMRDTKGCFGALKKGRARAAKSVTATAYSLAVSGKYPPMTMFWLKCRERWKEVHVHEHTGVNGAPLTFSALAAEAAEWEAKEAERQAQNVVDPPQKGRKK